MLAVVIFLGVLIVIAVVLLVVGMMRKLSDAPAPQAAGHSTFALSPGARVLDMQSQPQRLILHVRAADGDEIDIIDTEDGHLISRIKAAK